MYYILYLYIHTHYLLCLINDACVHLNVEQSFEMWEAPKRLLPEENQRFLPHLGPTDYSSATGVVSYEPLSHPGRDVGLCELVQVTQPLRVHEYSIL